MGKNKKTALNLGLLVVLSSLVTGFSAHAGNPDQSPIQKMPPERSNQVIGFYSKGRLQDPNRLVANGKGYLPIFSERDRHYGSDGLVFILEQVTSQMADRFPDSERLQIGDLSAARGGQITRHRSHQNGLDVDTSYYRVDRREQKDQEFNVGFDEEFVVRGKLTENFDLHRNWELAKVFHKTGRLDRIFTHEVIKQSLCDYARTIGEYDLGYEVLRKLRPFPNHGNHYHVRLTCPSTSPRCQTQEPIPGDGNGCDATSPLLDWEWAEGDTE